MRASHYRPTERLLYPDKDLSHAYCRYSRFLADSQRSSHTLTGVEISMRNPGDGTPRRIRSGPKIPTNARIRALLRFFFLFFFFRGSAGATKRPLTGGPSGAADGPQIVSRFPLVSAANVAPRRSVAFDLMPEEELYGTTGRRSGCHLSPDVVKISTHAGLQNKPPIPGLQNKHLPRRCSLNTITKEILALHFNLSFNLRFKAHSFENSKLKVIICLLCLVLCLEVEGSGEF